MKKQLCSIILALTILNSYFFSFAVFANTEFPTNEKLQFTLKFIDTTAGECEFETLPQTVWQGKNVHHFRATVKTVGLIKMIYPYTETVDLYYEKNEHLPLFVDINIQDRKKYQHTRIQLDSKSLTGEEIEESEEPNEPKHHRRKYWNIQPNSQSLFSILHFLRTQQLALGTKIQFPVAHDEKNALFDAEITQIEKVNIAKENFDALLLKIHPSFVQSFYPKVQEMPTLWISNDPRKLLLRFEFRHKLGKVFGVLKSRN